MATYTPGTGTRSGRSPLHPTGLNALDRIALVLMIIGANWGLVGVANFDLVAAILGDRTTASRIVYVLVGLAGLYGIATTIKMGSRNAAAAAAT